MTSGELARLDAERAAYLASVVKFTKKKYKPHKKHVIVGRVGRPPAMLPANWQAMREFILSRIPDYHRSEERLIVVCVSASLGVSVVAVARDYGISKQHARQILISLPRPKHVDTRRLVETIAAVCPRPVWR